MKQRRPKETSCLWGFVGIVGGNREREGETTAGEVAFVGEDVELKAGEHRVAVWKAKLCFGGQRELGEVFAQPDLGG